MSEDDSFIRHWSEQVYDRSQLAQIEEIERQLIRYAMDGWRPMEVAPPTDVLLIGAYPDGLLLVTQNQLGEWRTSKGVPEKPPLRWMPAPRVPKLNGGG